MQAKNIKAPTNDAGRRMGEARPMKTRWAGGDVLIFNLTIFHQVFGRNVGLIFFVHSWGYSPSRNCAPE